MRASVRRGGMLAVVLAAAYLLSAGTIVVSRVEIIPGYQRIRTEYTVTVFDDGTERTTIVAAHAIVTVGGMNDGASTPVAERSWSVPSPQGVPGGWVTTVPAEVIETVPPREETRWVSVSYDSPYELTGLVEASAFDGAVGTAHERLAEAAGESLGAAAVEAALAAERSSTDAADEAIQVVEATAIESNAVLVGDPVSVATGRLEVSESDLVLTAGEIELDLRRTHRTALDVNGSFGPTWFFALDTMIVFGEAPAASAAAGLAAGALQAALAARSAPPGLADLIAQATAEYRRRRDDALTEAGRARHLHAALGAIDHSGELADLVAAEVDRQMREASRIASELDDYAASMQQEIAMIEREVERIVTQKLDAKVDLIQGIADRLAADAAQSEQHAARNARFTTGVARAILEAGTSSLTVVGPAGYPSRYTVSGDGYAATLPPGDRLSRNPDWSYMLERSGGVRMRYGAFGELRSIHDRNGNGFEFHYDDDDTLVTITDTRGRTTCIVRNADRRIVMLVSPDGSRTEYGYDAQGRLRDVTDPVGDRTTFVYEGAGTQSRLTAIGRPDGAFRRYRYERERGRWRTVEAIDEEGAGEHFDFTVAGRTGYVDPGGLLTTHVFDDRNRTIRIEHPGSLTEEMTYDDRDKVLVHRAPDGSITSRSYDLRGNLVEVVHPDGTVEAWTWTDLDLPATHVDRRGFQTRYAYDPYGNLIAISHPDGTEDRFFRVAAGPAAGEIRTHVDRRGNVYQYEYDQHGFIRRVSDLLGVRELRRNDSLGRPVMIERPMGAVYEYEYREDGSLRSVTGPENLSLRYAYSARKDVVAVEENGRRTTVTYDARHLPLTLRNALGEEIRYGYRPDGRTTWKEVRDAAGAVVTRSEITYDERGLPATMRIPAIGAATTYEHDAAGRLAVMVDPNGERTEFSYTFDGRLSSRVRFLGQTQVREGYTFHPGGPIASVTDPLGMTREWFHDPAANTVTEIAADGSRRGRVQYDPYGLLLATSDATGRTMRYDYDVRGRLVEVWNDRHREVSYGYDQADRVTSVTDGEGATWRYEHDRRGRVTAVVNPDGSRRVMTYHADDTVSTVTDETGRTIVYEYDQAGRLVSRLEPAADRTARTSYEWDALGLVSAVTDPTGRTVRTIRDAAGRAVASIDAGEARTDYVLDPAGRLREVIDAAGRSIRYEYDRLGRLVAIRRGHEYASRFEYDLAGNLIAWIDGLGHAHRSSYDGLGRLARETNRSGAEKVYRYDLADRIESVIDYTGVVARHEYDAVGRLSEVSYSDGSYLRYTYDRTGRITVAESRDDRTELAYDSRGRLTAIRSDASGAQLLYRYDAAGRVASRWDEAAGTRTDYQYDARGFLVGIDDSASGSTTVAYDEAGRRTALVAANGVTTAWRYDAAGLVSAILVTNPAGRLLDGVASVRDEAGLRLFDVDHEGAITGYRYDERGRLVAVQYPYDGPKKDHDLAALLAMGVPPTDSVAGRSLTDYLDLAPSQAHSISQAYRLIQPLRKGAPTPYQQVWTERFTYDAADNRTSWSTSHGELRYEYDDHGRLASAGGVSYSYDMAGNLVEERGPSGTTRYAYSAQQRLRQVQTDDTTVTYGYDAVGRRVLRTSVVSPASSSGSALRKPVGAVASHRTVLRYEGLGFSVSSREEISFFSLTALDLEHLAKPPAQGGRYRPPLDSAGARMMGETERTRFTEVSLDGRPITVTGPGGSRYVSHDVLGSPRVSATRWAVIDERYGFDAYGSLLGGILCPAQPYGYTGKPRDRVTGLYDYGFRDYLPSTGRFTTPDPIKWGANWYAYVDANPVNFTDPLGLMPVSDRVAAAHPAIPPVPASFYQLPEGALQAMPRERGEGVWSIVANVLETQSRVSRLTAAQDQVMADPRLAPGAGGPYSLPRNPGHTWCNIAVRDIAEELGLPARYLTGGGDRSNTRANEMGERLALQSAWATSPDHRNVFAVTPERAQALANEGRFVVASWINPSGRSGHIAAVRPSGEAYVASRGPYLANIGASVASRYTVDAFAVGRGHQFPASMDEISYYFIRSH